jgi:acyl-coenzyme A synthetase/AMP-(fatty) acid ligase
VGPQLLANFSMQDRCKDYTSELKDPMSPSYVIFTSGSTGKPKGVVVENRAMATSCWHHGLVIGLKTTSRVLQFASYAFDASIQEIITTLVHGGTICILSTHDVQTDLEGGIRNMAVNTAYLTPTVTKFIDPAAVPGLMTILQAGGSSTLGDFTRWSRPKQGVLHGHGPTECAILCSLATVELDTPDEVNPACIGTATGGTSWVVDPDNHEKLLPIGAIGELPIEGHILARVYLNDQDKTNAAFISLPDWLMQNDPSRCGRLYKTGDLVSYNADGSLTYHFRKDTQVKIRGQRVELAGVEAALFQCLDNAVQVVSEIIHLVGHGANPRLAAFVAMASSDEAASFIPRHSEGEVGILPVSESFETRMSELVPSYMVPSVCFFIKDLPLNFSGKADRKKVNEIGSSFSVTNLAALRRIEGLNMRKPLTDAEQLLCNIVAKVLNLDVASIGLDDDFYRLGGDSITTIQLSSAARSQCLDISTAIVTKHKTISRILEASNFNSHYGLPPTNSHAQN